LVIVIVAVLVSLICCALCYYCLFWRKAKKKAKPASRDTELATTRTWGTTNATKVTPIVASPPAAKRVPPPAAATSDPAADRLRFVFKLNIIDAQDRFKGFHELPMGNTDSIDLIIKMGFSLKKMTPHVEDDDLTGMFARALCDAQLVKYCYQAIRSLPPNLANPLASLLAQDTNIRWPEVTSTNTQLLVSLSQKILANDREWIIHHSRIVNLKDNVEAKDVIQTCNSYTALSLLLNRIVLDEKAFPSLDETLNGILRCAAWLVDNFITSLFLMFNITFMSTVGKALDDRQKKEKIAQCQGPAAATRARASQLRRVKTSKTNAEATSATAQISGLFDEIDSNHDGKLNAEELFRGLCMINPSGNWTLDSVTNLIRQSNCTSTDSTGQITLDISEFAEVMGKIATEKKKL
jgi:hypothetical protein